MPTTRLRVCLERTVELEGLRLRAARLARACAGRWSTCPIRVLGRRRRRCRGARRRRWRRRYRVLSLQPRGASPYQVDAADLLAMLDQFGFRAPVLVGERLGCVAGTAGRRLVRRPRGGLVLVDPPYDRAAS